MPEVIARHFGAIHCDENAVLLFPDGLPAFEREKQFVLIEQPATSPAVFLQSLDDGALCFVALPVLAVMPDYELSMSLEDLVRLELDETRQPEIGREVACFAILTVTENGPSTANLLAPIVVNLRTRRCLQAVRLDAVYSHRHPLPEPEAAPCS